MSRYITEEVLKRAEEIEGLIVGDNFSHGVSVKDRSFWDNITRLDKEALIKKAEEYINEPFPTLTDEEYLNKSLAKKNDKVWFTSMRRVEQAVLAECIENKGRFLPFIKEGIKSICARKSWVRSGHNSGFSYSDYYRVHKLVDLYSSSVAWRMANIDSCIGELLGDDIRELIKEKVKEHVVDVFKKRLDEEYKYSMIYSSQRQQYNIINEATVKNYKQKVRILDLVNNIHKLSQLRYNNELDNKIMKLNKYDIKVNSLKHEIQKTQNEIKTK